MGNLEQQLAQSRNELRLLQAELIRQNQQLSAANVELQHLSEVKSSFVSVAAHELRSPLASILGYTEVLLEQDFGELSAKQTEFLQIVQRSANRLLNVSMNLLDANRIETGRIDLLLKPLDLAALIKGCVAEFEVQSRHKGQKLALHTEPDLPMALCDETKTTQIINNLLSNASKYTLRGGKITVNLRQADETGFLLLSVTDTGIGIAPREHKELFGRFFRASNAYQTGAGGSGLGLYITRSLVELHGGRIWVKSELGVGSTFFVTFPQN
jgi:signal transduction histidine kinase